MLYSQHFSQSYVRTKPSLSGHFKPVPALTVLLKGTVIMVVTGTCEASQVLLAGVQGGFSQGSPVSPHLPIGLSHTS